MSDRIKHSQPISIPNNAHSHSRTRSASLSSDDESNSPPLQTPSSSAPAPRVNTAQSPSTSPILSYFFQSPTKVASVIPQSPTSGFGSIGRGFSAKPQEQPIMEENEEQEPAIVRQARRMSTSAGWAPPAAPRFNPVSSSEQSERGAGLLRRLSLGNPLGRAQPPSPPSQNTVPNSHVPAAPTPTTQQPVSPGRKKRRASTLGVPGEGVRPRRSPSPMGERILKGHFDGFN